MFISKDHETKIPWIKKDANTCSVCVQVAESINRDGNTNSVDTPLPIKMP